VPPPLVLRFRICPAEGPETTLAEVFFTVGPDGDQGSLEVRAEDPAMRTLVLYHLIDPQDARPVYLHGVGYRHGPHTRSAEQLCLSLGMLSSSFPAFRAMEFVDPAVAGGDAPSAGAGPTTMRAPPSPWADLRFLLDDFSVERGVGNEESVAALFAALAEGRPPSSTERYLDDLGQLDLATALRSAAALLLRAGAE
jgi:hypothetical protein